MLALIKSANVYLICIYSITVVSSLFIEHQFFMNCYVCWADQSLKEQFVLTKPFSTILHILETV